MKVNHRRNLYQIHKDIVILQKHRVDHRRLVFRLDFLVIQIHNGIYVEGLDYLDFIKYNHKKFKTVAVDHAEDRSLVVLLDFKGLDVRPFELELKAGRVVLHVVNGDGVVGHG